MNSFPLKGIQTFHSSSAAKSPCSLNCHQLHWRWFRTESRQRFLHGGFCPAMMMLQAVGKMALVVVLGTREVRMHRQALFCIFAGDLCSELRDSLSSLCCEQQPPNTLRPVQAEPARQCPQPKRTWTFHPFPLKPKPHDLLPLLTIPDQNALSPLSISLLKCNLVKFHGLIWN